MLSPLGAVIGLLLCGSTASASRLVQPVSDDVGDPVSSRGTDSIEMPSVVLVRARIDAGSAAWRGAELRIAADLRAAGFDVIDVVDAEWPGATSRSLRDYARFHRAAASVRVRRNTDTGEIELWIAERGDRPALGRTTRVAEPARGEAVEEAALYTVEVLFAGVLELPVVESRVPADAKVDSVGDGASSIDVATTSSRRRNWLIRMAAMGTTSPGGAGPFVGFGLGSTVFVLPQVGVDVLLNGAAGLRPIRNDAGHARWRHGAARLGVLGRPWPNARVSPALGVAFGGWGIVLDGEATGPHQGRRVMAFAGLPTAMARIDVELGTHWRLHIGTLVAWSLRPVVVQFDGREVASGGSPLVELAVGFEYRLR